MIKLTRSRVESHIVPSFRAPKQEERLIELMEKRREKLLAGEDPKLKFSSKWGSTKRQLLVETHQKCAYCETHTTVVAFGDVEHYRPKSIYWWLAYCYDNYLASCSICNQQFKSNHFEFDGPKMRGPVIRSNTTDARIATLAEEFVPDPLDEDEVSEFEDKHRAEEPLLPNPYIEDPEQIFAWEVLQGAKQVLLVPNPAHPRSEDIVDACERLYGLNRSQLTRRRFKQWENYAFQLAVFQSPGVPGDIRDAAEEFIRASLEPESEYAGMIRFFESQRPGGFA